ncbi:potassium-transporting ATPase subunit C [Streptomyces sp. RY43-2]|uniref:Potassium-transporting ATPase KdpC subunit n=1 Tax=Streptomyces macrolidinus TaxID=2952607 RepID=A0ABT0ZFD6_9ACTN|nr:potassium-transporting ATPase subunit C [Streptomyces macrolidinus]MCN9242296.1 potassium-transporting ATPase subunit C [Streptomyces macrolidinus]
MNNSLRNTARLLGAGLRALLVLTLVTGVVYPLVVTGVAQAFFPGKANGSRVGADGKVVGSSLIGQSYDLPSTKGDQPPAPDLKWFQGRPAHGLGTNTVNTRYKLLVSGATNLAADTKALREQVEAARAAVVEDNSVPGYTVEPSDIPADAVTSSGSGLDPDISPQYARIQVHRVAVRNGLPVERVAKLVEEHTQGRTLGFMGEPRVNVLALNTALRDLTA